MPRPLPALSTDFKIASLRLLELVRRLELNFKTVKHGNSSISLTNLQLTYELAYLKAFLAWETFQEAVFLRLMCGYAGPNGQEPLQPGVAYYRSTNDANAALLAGKDFVLWHNRDVVVKPFDRYFNSPASPFRSTLANSPRLPGYSAIRHRIAHLQDHARAQFDQATNLIAHKRYRGSRPGEFLRDQDITLPDRPRYLKIILDDLGSLADNMN